MRKVILGFGLVALMMMVMNNSASAFSWTWHKLADNNGVKVYIAERSFKSNLLDIESEKVYQVEYWMKVSNGKAEAKSHLMGRINKETKEMYYKVIEGEEILDEDVEYTENDGETLDEQFEKMTGAKRTTVRIVSALLLLLIVAGVVFGTDAIMNFIKEFFG